MRSSDGTRGASKLVIADTLACSVARTCVRCLVSERFVFESVLASAVARRGVALMGICNVTPDSFSDGGAHFSREAACAHVDRLIAEGADLIDIGGESTRPGSKPVSGQEQIRRVREVVRYASQKTLVSIDTTSPDVADACLRAGACVINDVSCLRDPRLADVAADHQAPLVLMHSRESQEHMPGFSKEPETRYQDVVAEVISEWTKAADEAKRRGVRSIVMDPGLGFNKSAKHSMTLLANTSTVAAAVAVPVLIGASRKSFLQSVDPDAGPNDRIGASVSAAVFAASHGAKLVRVHDVRGTRQAIDLSRMLRGEHA